MARVKTTLLGFWVLLSILLFKLLFLLLAYLTLRNFQRSMGRRYTISIFSTADAIIIFFLLAEMLVYWMLRHKIRDMRWVRWHVWTLFFFMVVFPLVAVALTGYLGSVLNRKDYSLFLTQSRELRFYLFWLVVPGAHIFFIATIVKSFRPVKELYNDEAPGLLDEFIS